MFDYLQDPSGQAGADIFGGGSLANLTGAEAGAPSFDPSGGLGTMGPTGTDSSTLAGLTGSEATSAPTFAAPDIGSIFGGSGGIPGLIGPSEMVGSKLAALLGPLFGLNTSGAGGTGGMVGGGIGAGIGSIFGPLGTMGGTALGDLLGTLAGNWVGGGVPGMAKTGAFRNALSASGDPLEQLLARYMMRTPHTSLSATPGTFGSTGGNTARMANILQLLAQMQMGDQSLGKLSPSGGNLGFQNKVGLGGVQNINALMGQYGGGKALSLAQLDQILPLLSRIVNRGGSMSNVVSGSEQLAEKLRQAESY